MSSLDHTRFDGISLTWAEALVLYNLLAPPREFGEQVQPRDEIENAALIALAGALERALKDAATSEDYEGLLAEARRLVAQHLADSKEAYSNVFDSRGRPRKR